MHIDETLSDDSFPNSHWLKIRTNGPLERIMKEIPLRSRVVGAFPDGQSGRNPTGARLRHIAGNYWSTRKYMTMGRSRASPTVGCPWQQCRRWYGYGPQCGREPLGSLCPDSVSRLRGNVEDELSAAA